VTPFALIALLGWIPYVIVMFAIKPTHRAAAIGVIGARLSLPPYRLTIAGQPDYSKTSAAFVGLLAGDLIVRRSSRQLLSSEV